MLGAHKIMFFESALLTAGLCLLAMLIGLVVGSYAHRIAWRLSQVSVPPRGSRCRTCGHPLTFAQSIPLVGWLTMGGVCPYCGEPLGVDKPAVELLCAGMFASVVLRHGLSIETVEVLSVITIMLVTCLSALWDYRIPNGCMVAAVFVRIAYLAAQAVAGESVASLAVSSAVGAVALGVPLALAIFLSNAMLARDISGMGTAKLVAVVGLYLGWQQGLLAMAGACALWVFVWVLSPSKVLEVEVAGGAHRVDDPNAGPAVAPRDLRATLEEDFTEPMRLIPFAPCIAIALWVMLLLGVVPAAWSAPIL